MIDYDIYKNGKPWSKQDENHAVSSFHNNTSFYDIGKQLGRKPSAVFGKLCNLGYIKINGKKAYLRNFSFDNFDKNHYDKNLRRLHGCRIEGQRITVVDSEKYLIEIDGDDIVVYNPENAVFTLDRVAFETDGFERLTLKDGNGSIVYDYYVKSNEEKQNMTQRKMVVVRAWLDDVRVDNDKSLVFESEDRQIVTNETVEDLRDMILIYSGQDILNIISNLNQKYPPTEGQQELSLKDLRWEIVGV